MVPVHVTERSQYKSCRRAWRYAYKDLIRSISERRGALWFGTGIHAGLEAYYAKQSDPVEAFNTYVKNDILPDEWDSMFEDEQDRINEMIELGQTMLQGYVPFAQKNDDWEIVAVEQPLEIRVPRTYTTLTGRIDLLVRHNKKLWVVDHKSYTNFVSAQDLELDDQMTAYLWLVWQKYDEIPGGAIYNQLRKKIPAEPLVLKSGKLSKDKSIDTTFEKYHAAIKANNLEESDYQDMLDSLTERRFYRREYVARTPLELKRFTRQLADELREMKRRTTVIYPHVTRDCSWNCGYRMLCKAENEGGDVESLKEFNYEKTERRR